MVVVYDNIVAFYDIPIISFCSEERKEFYFSVSRRRRACQFPKTLVQQEYFYFCGAKPKWWLSITLDLINQNFTFRKTLNLKQRSWQSGGVTVATLTFWICGIYQPQPATSTVALQLSSQREIYSLSNPSFCYYFNDF